MKKIERAVESSAPNLSFFHTETNCLQPADRVRYFVAQLGDEFLFEIC